MAVNNLLPLAQSYNDLAHLLFMLQMSYINPSSVDAVELKIKIDNLIAVIHAHNVIENTII